MAEEVVITSLRNASEDASDAKVADVKALFDTHVNDGKVVLVVEGPDDKEVYEKVTDAASVCIYVDCNCEKHFVILDALNSRYARRLLAIKDADFDRLEGKRHSYPNLVLTDTHDMEGMIVGGCLTGLVGDDAERCRSVNLGDIYSELTDVSEKELCNGHDILERIYVRAKAVKVANFAKKPFFRRLRRAYPAEKFVSTQLFKDIKKWETVNGYAVLAV